MRDENQRLHGRDAHAPLAFASHTLSSHFRISESTGLAGFFECKSLYFSSLTFPHQHRCLTNLSHKIDYPFLIGAFVSLIASVAIWFRVSPDYGLFVGIWVPSIFSLWVGVRVVILSAAIKTREVQ